VQARRNDDPKVSVGCEGVGNPTLGSAFAVRVGHPCMPMNERERRELQRLRDEFVELMRREIDAALFDEEAKRRLGQAISRSTTRSSRTSGLGHDGADHRVVAANVVEAVDREPAYALLARVAERHRWAGWVAHRHQVIPLP
jgi:hypothetical protein